MSVVQLTRRRRFALIVAFVVLAAAISMPAQQMVTETRDPSQPQDEEFARLVAEWTTEPSYLSPLVDHLPKVKGVPSPNDVLGHHIGAPATLTYYADILKYYRALAAATPRVKVETIGKSDEDRELVVVWVSSDENIKNLPRNRDNLAKIADPRSLSPDQIKQLIATTRPHYHLMGGLHSGETGPSEMLMELVYRLATETSPLIRQIRDNVIVSVTPVADADGRDRNVDWFYRGLETAASNPPAPPAEGAAGTAAGAGAGTGAPPGIGAGGGGGLPYWGKYVYHDNNRDINLSQMSMRALADWYFTAHPPIMHDLHEAQALMYTYSGAAPQNPNLDPILFAELPWFSNFELAQMTKWGMPGVYTHAFMDGWSPGYLGSVAYNHNGMMRMYETQSGREAGPGGGGGRADGRGRGGDGRGGRGGDAAAATGDGGRAGRGGEVPATGETADPFAGRGRGPSPPTGRGGSQTREWYRGLPVPPGAVANFSRRNNTNYMETGVLSALQLTASFPNLIVENFYQKTKNSIESGKKDAPFGFVIPVQRDMTRVATLVNILRAQRIEVGQAAAEIKTADGTFAAGSYVIKRDQPYGRLAKNLLEKQSYPDPDLRTYDDSGWTMGLAMLVDVKEIKDKAILDVKTTPIEKAAVRGKINGNGTAGLAVAHFGSSNMIALRYKLRDVPMKVADKAFSAEGIEFPAGSIVIAAPPDPAAVRQAIEQLGLTGASLSTLPSVTMHEADVPRIAMYSSWSGNDTQEIGWVRFAFDTLGIPYDLIYKERLRKGNLRDDYDVLLMPNQNASRQAVFQPPAARAVPYMKNGKYMFLGMYGESPDITGGMGGEGVDAVAKFLDAGGTLIAMGNAVRFATEQGFARTVDASASTSRDFYAPRPLVNAEILHQEHPVFYGYADRMLPIKYQNAPLLTVGAPDQSGILARYVGGDAGVLSGLMKGADEIRQRPFVVDVPGGRPGKGRVVLFANNPIYRWQNHGEFNMVFNALINWNDLGVPSRSAGAISTAGSR
jgi:8-oxo-dGTP pyrophosphatase MutT (NUDIX family)